MARLDQRKAGHDVRPNHNGTWYSSIWGAAAFARVAMNGVWLTSFSSRQSAGVHPPARMVLNRGRRRRQKGVEPLLHHGVAFTRCLFEAWTIDDLDLPLAVVDETVGLHRLRGKRHRFPIGAQHVSQKFVRV
jgi:hypothetical protein